VQFKWLFEQSQSLAKLLTMENLLLNGLLYLPHKRFGEQIMWR